MEKQRRMKGNRSSPSRRHLPHADPAAHARAPPPAPLLLASRGRPPLFLRPSTHPVPEVSVAAFLRRAAAPIPPSAPHLHHHLRWLLADASAPSPSGSDLVAPYLLRGLLGNEHWKDLVVAVRDGVLIPGPETEAVVDMVATTDCEQASWSYLSSSSAFD
ncbi:uncharacterized protein [Triticum aestivum]|uniref:uncharacterized protein n=1 Tax=Triticum aestivum TaxID=4565 RepID=UPI001D030ECD|nr:uncharacterized protein LOC123139381 [Triticum aestivum]